MDSDFYFYEIYRTEIVYFMKYTDFLTEKYIYLDLQEQKDDLEKDTIKVA